MTRSYGQGYGPWQGPSGRFTEPVTLEGIERRLQQALNRESGIDEKALWTLLLDIRRTLAA